MAIELQHNANTRKLVISGELTIYHIEEVRAALLAHPDALLDLDGVEEVDGAGVQLLLAYGRDNPQNEAVLSDAIKDALRLIGIEELTGVES